MVREMRIGEDTTGKLVGVIQRYVGHRRYYVVSDLDAWRKFVIAELGFY